MAELSWHQMQKIRMDHQLRNAPAHILDPDMSKGMLSLCGVEHPQVKVDYEFRRNPANKTCSKCCSKADKLKLPTDPKYP